MSSAVHFVKVICTIFHNNQSITAPDAVIRGTLPNVQNNEEFSDL
jgi:hypothetical protein